MRERCNSPAKYITVTAGMRLCKSCLPYAGEDVEKLGEEGRCDMPMDYKRNMQYKERIAAKLAHAITIEES